MILKSSPSDRESSRSSTDEESKGMSVLESRRLISELRSPKSSSLRSQRVLRVTGVSSSGSSVRTAPLLSFGAAVSSSSVRRGRSTFQPFSVGMRMGMGLTPLSLARFTSIKHSTAFMSASCFSAAFCASSKEMLSSFAAKAVHSTTAISLMPLASRLVMREASSCTVSGKDISSSQTPAKICPSKRMSSGCSPMASSTAE